MQYESFFMIEVPAMLKNLQPDDKPRWGSMSAIEMLDHLRKGVDISITNVNGVVSTPDDKLPAYKHFLMSDKPFKPNAAMPEEFNTLPAFGGDIEDHKVNLMKSLVKMQVYFKKNPAHLATHAYFGNLNIQEWAHLHRKHILHHFEQFNLTRTD